MARPPVFQLPTVISSPISLQVQESVTETAPFGRFLRQDVGQYMWSVKGRLLYVLNSKTGELVSSWKAPSSTEITSVCELQVSETQSFLVLAFIVGSRHILGVLQPSLSRLIRAIDIPHQITAVHSISSNNLSTPGLFSQTLLSHFSGIVAVGCIGGHAYVLDLSLGHGDNAKTSLENARQVYVVDPRDRAVGAEVTHAKEAGRHVCVELTANRCHGRNFIYDPPEEPTPKSLPSESVAVTTLHFVPQICSLLLGFNFGTFQIYSLSQLVAVYSSPSTPQLAPVTHFTYQEPENDPRGFVYFWVARGASPYAESTKSEVRISLYQLIYANTVKIEGSLGMLHQNLQMCNFRFDYALTPTPSLPNPRTSYSSRLIHCATLEHHRGGRGLDESHDEIEAPSHGPDLTLAAFIWSCGHPSSPQHFMGLFDINQWYHAQMPRILQWRMSGRHTGVLGCSYFAFFSLDPALETEEMPLLDAMVQGVSPVRTLPPIPESHTWPTALAFDVYGLTCDSVTHCKFYGLQRAAIQELSRSGMVMLAEPQRVFSLCEQADLLGQLAWEGGMEHSDPNFQVKALLSVALDHGLVPTLRTCVEKSGADQTTLMVDWVRSKVKEVAEEKDQLCHPLFSGSAHPVDTPTQRYLQRLVVLLQRMAVVIQSLLSPSSQREDVEIDATVQELITIYYGTVVQCHLLEVINWCIRNHLLPLSNDESHGEGFCYPSVSLQRLYERLRSGQPHKLVVDYVTDDVQNGEEFSYPSSAFDEFLAIFTTPNMIHQHCLMIYFLRDIDHLEENGRYKELVSRYSRMFSLPRLLTSFAQGLWCLDHQKYEEAMKLLMCQSAQTQWFFWQHNVVITTLLQAGQETLALQYLQVYGSHLNTVEDIKLKISVRVTAGCLPSALEIVRVFQTLQSSETYMEICNHFLDCCYQTKQLRMILELPLNYREEEFFCAYLEDHPCLRAQLLLVIFYLHRNRYVEALHMHEKIKPLAKAEPDPKVRAQFAAQESLIAAYSKGIPDVLREIPTQPSPSQTTQRTTVENVVPLSRVLAREAQNRAVSQTNVINTIIESVAAARSVPAEPLTPFRPRDKKGISDLSHTPFLSTPKSVRKVRAERANPPLVIPTLVHSPPPTISPLLTPVPENMMLTEFRSMIQSFQSRLAQLTQSDNSVLDTSVIRTPFKTPLSIAKRMPPSVATPPSILKVRPLVERESEATGDVIAEPPRRIRFAVEGTPLASPGSSPPLSHKLHVFARPPTPYAPSSTSPPSDPSQMAAATPLPSGDDSDLFLSPMESPSDIKRDDSHQMESPSEIKHGDSHQMESPSDTKRGESHPPAKMKLFATTSATPEVPEDLDMPENTAAATTPDVHSSRVPYYLTPILEDVSGIEAHSDDPREASDMEDNLQEEGEPDEATHDSPSIVGPPTTPSQKTVSLKGLSVKLTRDSIKPAVYRTSNISNSPNTCEASTNSFKVTTTSVLSQSSPFHLSPLVTHVRTASDTPLSMRPTTTKKPGLFTPVLTSQIIETKKKEFLTSLEATRRKDVAEILTPSVTVVKDHPSATMIRPLDDPTERLSFQDTMPFGFSPPTEAVPPTIPLIQKTLQESTPAQSYAFSPPLTRSEVRRRKKEVPTPGELAPPDVEGNITTRKPRGRPRKSTRQSTKSSRDEVALLSPPPQEDVGEEVKEHQKRRRKPVKTTTATRRSTRLLRDNK